MTEDDDVQHRAYHQPDPDRVELRDPDDEDEDGVFSIRMPIVSTGDVRNDGDDPFSRDELAGMARQIEERPVGVFLDHGASALGGGGGMFGNRYSAIGKVGEWAAPDVIDTQDGDGPALLEADARLMDPETLSSETGEVREALAALKSQVERGFALSSSIGWRQDDTSPGGNDLMEASIVGIGADPRTVSESTAAVARAAVESGVDPDEFLDELRDVVMGPDAYDGREAGDTVTDDESASGEQSEDTTEEQDEQRDAPEWAQELLEEQQKQTELLNTIDDAVREDDDEEDESEDEDEEDEEDEEQSADADDESGDGGVDEQSSDAVDELRDAVEKLREGGIDVTDVELPDADTSDEQAADDEDETDSATTDGYDKYGLKTGAR